MLPLIGHSEKNTPTLLCLAGSMISPRVFDNVHASSGFHKVYVDYLNSSGPWDIATLANQLVETIDENQWGRIVLAGYSAGGVIALAAASLAPDRIHGMLLSNTGMNASNHGDPDFPRKLLENWNDSEFIAAFIRRCFSRPVDPVFFEDMMRYAQTLNPQSAYQVSTSLRQTDLTEAAARITCPVSIVHGIDDTVRKVEHAEALKATLPNSKLVLIHGGHTIMMENLKEWQAELDDLLARTVSGK